MVNNNMKFFFLVILYIHFICVSSRTIFVSEYGAYPNDGIDDTKAIQSAIDAAIQSTLTTTINFGSGIYNLSSTIAINNATNLAITGQGMNQTFLVGNVPMLIFWPQFSTGLTFRRFTVDFDPLPFTGGYIVNITDNYLDLQVQAPHRTDIGRQVLGIHRFDPVEMRPAFGPNTYEIYQVPPVNVTTSVVSPGVLRIPLAFRPKFTVGEAVVAIYGPRNDVIHAHDITDLTIQSVAFRTSWYMGLVVIRGRRITISDYHIKPHDGLWLSANADCIHLSDAREYIHLSDSKCEMQGDDGLNVHSQYFVVTEILNSTTLIVSAFNWTDPLNIDDGTVLEFSYNDEPFTPYGTATVASSTFAPPTSRIFTFTSSVNVSIGDYACVGEPPALTIRNFTVERNRARGILLETRNVDVRNCVFNRTSGAAVLFQPSLYWHESITGRNVTLANNLYINNNEGIGQFRGIIAVSPDPLQPIPVINDIRIESSSFYFGNYSQGLLEGSNANNIYLTGNYLSTNTTNPLITICNSRNITASNNTVIDSQGKLNQYFEYDQRSVCQVNRSSLIDLPPSAFNSSFAPPVLFN